MRLILIWDKETLEHLARHSVSAEEAEQACQLHPYIMKSRIPNFKSLEEEREFWQKHSITEFLDELKPVKAKFIKPHSKPSISIKLSPAEAHVLQDILARLTNVSHTHVPVHSKH